MLALKLDIKPLFGTVQLSGSAFENSIQFIIGIPFNVMCVYVCNTLHIWCYETAGKDTTAFSVTRAFKVPKCDVRPCSS